MPIINFTTREVRLKIALHGTPASGRAATLAKLHADSPASKGGLAIPEDAKDKPFSFSFSGEDRSVFEGFTTRFEFHSLTGGPSSPDSVRLLLRDADGVVFVVDSQWEKLEDNLQSLQEAEEALKADGSALDEIPWVLQYNKRDLPEVAPANYIDFLLNNRSKPAPVFETVATTGDGIPALRKAIVERVLARFAEEYGQKLVAPEEQASSAA